MDRFLEIATSFPTLPLSVLLLLAIAYWLLGLAGLLELDVLDLPDLGDGGDAAAGAAGGLNALLMKFGLGGLPFALIYTALVFFAWIACYFIDYFLLTGWGAGAIRIGAAAVLTPALLFLALPFAGLLLQPAKQLFARAEGRHASSLLGETVLIRSPLVDESQGTAEYDDGGAGLILQVRAAPGEFRRGDRALIVDYQPERNAYRITRSQSAPKSVSSPQS